MFVRVYLDENISVLVADLIRSRGFEALTARDAGNVGWTDDQQLQFATKNEMAILTHDRLDFEDLAKEYFVEGKTHCGIIIAQRRRPHLLTERLMKVINRVMADEIVDQILYI